MVHQFLPCDLLEFPCRYLRLPLSFTKLTRDQLQPIINKIVDQLLGWKSDLLTKCDILAQCLIELIEYSYQQGILSFVGAQLQRTLGSSVLDLW
jgi:hypothetical protein